METTTPKPFTEPEIMELITRAATVREIHEAAYDLDGTCPPDDVVQTVAFEIVLRAFIGCASRGRLPLLVEILSTLLPVLLKLDWLGRTVGPPEPEGNC